MSTNLTRNGFVTPTPVQAQAIPAAFTGRDVVATAQTGTGKTLAFALPILESLIKAPRANGVRALVLSPTRELALQIQAAFDQLAANTGIRTAVVVGGLNEGSQLRAIRGGASIVIATPGRLCDFIDRRLVRLSSLSVLVLDEADRMLDMGFLPSLRRILSELPASRQTLFFSATIEPSVAHLVDSHLKNPVRIAVDPLTKPAENVALDLYEVEPDGKAALLHQLIAKETGSVLVFARTKHGADKLAKNLVRAGVKASRIHGDRTQNQRNEALSRFQRGECQVLVATDIAARGIHVDAIAHVINYDLPQVPEDFIHRVGRTGRAGASGVASTFVTRAQRSDIARIEKTMKLKMQRRPYTAPPQPANVIVLPVKPTGAPARSFTPRTRRAR